jgi:ubiquinone/menaquinone biosynthesis C-methylase UbiE
MVVGLDTALSLLDHAKVRAEAEGVQVEFQEGNAERIPFENASFDGVISTFGVQFTANPEAAASELLRVCRSGGVIALANWSPGEFVQAFGTAIAGYVQGPAQSPFLWGTENRIRELLGSGLASVSFTTRTFVYRLRTPEAYVELFRNTYGPMISAFAAVTEEKREVLAESLSRAVRRCNRSGDKTLVLPIEYQEVVAIRS